MATLTVLRYRLRVISTLAFFFSFFRLSPAEFIILVGLDGYLPSGGGREYC